MQLNPLKRDGIPLKWNIFGVTAEPELVQISVKILVAEIKNE